MVLGCGFLIEPLELEAGIAEAVRWVRCLCVPVGSLFQTGFPAFPRGVVPVFSDTSVWPSPQEDASIPGGAEGLAHSILDIFLPSPFL